MNNPIITLAVIIIGIGASIVAGVFKRLGPIETPRGMSRLGWTVIGIGFLTALTQSTPTPPVANDTTTTEASTTAQQPR